MNIITATCEHTTIIERLEARIAELEELVRLDSMTRLYNHASIEEHLARECKRSGRTGEPLAIAMLDIDYFKKVNDNYGHRAGDAVLKGLAQFLKTSLRATDIIGRWGGEEFVVIFTNTTAERAAQVLDQLREQFAGMCHHKVSVTFSAGVAQYKGGSYTALVGAADKALYRAKHNGRNQVSV